MACHERPDQLVNKRLLEEAYSALSGPLFVRRRAKKEWIMLDESSQKLLAYPDEETSQNPKKDPLYTIPLANAGFCIEEDSPCTFSILGSKKYTYQAETHSAMIAWLNHLKACRFASNEDEKRFGPNGLDQMGLWASTLPKSNQRVSENYLLRSLSRTYSFTSVKSGILKTKSPSNDSTINSPNIHSPVAESNHFFPEDSPDSPPSKTMISAAGSEHGSYCGHEDANSFLKSELRQALEKVDSLQKKNDSLEEELNDLKIGYLTLLQSCYIFDFEEWQETSTLSLNLQHKERILKLLQTARIDHPNLPTASLTRHTDWYGFQETFDNERRSMLYLTSQLLSVYSMRSPTEEWKLRQWHEILAGDFASTPRKRLKELCRKGIPPSLRESVWSKLIEMAIGKTKSEYGPQYYQKIVNKINDGQVDPAYRRQITLDVLRTFPNHVAFNKPEGFGVQKMQEVLQAFTLHNPTVGYCQGMNFIVGTAALFLDKETVFWLLVLVVEHYFPSNYFNAGLIAAQADQIVLRGLIGKYCPKIAEAVQSLEVDISTITFNWFIAVFVSSVPLETLLRIWDVFLLEGHKVLFRVSIALLMRQQDALIRQTDTLAFWKSLKTSTSLVHDHENLMHVAFEGFPMITRKELNALREAAIGEIEKRLKQNPKFFRNLSFKREVSTTSGIEDPTVPHVSCVSSFDDASPCFLMFCEENGQNSIKLGNVEEDVYYSIETQFTAPISCAASIKEHYVLLGSNDGYLYAFDIGLKVKTWELKVSAPITAIAVVKREDGSNAAFIGQADGTLTLILDLVGLTAPRDHYHQLIGFISISSIVIADGQAWCACGNMVEIFDVETFDHVNKITVSDNPLDLIYCLAPTSYGVWISVGGKSVVRLWSTTSFDCIQTCEFDKYSSSKTTDHSDDFENPERVTAMLANESHLFIGTNSGTVFIYKTLKWKKSVSLPVTPNLSLSRKLAQIANATNNNSSSSNNGTSDNSKSIYRPRGSQSDVDDSYPTESATERHNSQDSGNVSLEAECNDSKPSQAEVSRKKSVSSGRSSLLFTSRSQVTESPIRAFVQVTTKQGTCIISFSQRCNEGDAVLKWLQTSKAGNKWTNSPMLELSTKNSAPILTPYLKSAALRKQSSVAEPPP